MKKGSFRDILDDLFFCPFYSDFAYIVRNFIEIHFVCDRMKVNKIRKANKVMTNQLIYTGKAKDIYTTEDEHVIKSVYKDQATMLNGARKETIKGKGVLNNQISSSYF